MAVGRVLEGYDADRSFPVFGFGAGLPPSGAVSHCFSLGASPAQPEVQGVQGILEAYRQVAVTFSSPARCPALLPLLQCVWLGSSFGPSCLRRDQAFLTWPEVAPLCAAGGSCPPSRCRAPRSSPPSSTRQRP